MLVCLACNLMVRPKTPESRVFPIATDFLFGNIGVIVIGVSSFFVFVVW
jgi:hypothetical protein